jgi:hypothetical protein
MSMYPDESIKDSPSEKRRKIYARLFWVFLATTLLLAASSIYLNFSSFASLQSNDAPSEPTQSATPSPNPSSTGITSNSAAVEKCNSVVEAMPGDLEIVLSWGWEIECVESGKDPDLGENGLLEGSYTVGYADSSSKRIAIDAPEVTAAIIAHEAAHALDVEQLAQADRVAMAAKYGATDWDEVTDYFNRPSEMFAEARMRCLGYDHDPDYGVMSCEDVDILIAGTEQADLINKMANSNS